LSVPDYVQGFLRPGFQLIREQFSGTPVVAAAPVGMRIGVASRFCGLTEAEADDFCDYRAVHVSF
jgi:hypothetical protein